MEKKPSYYKLLEVGETASPDEIKAAYRRLARTYHPDVNPGNRQAEERFKQIGEAYATLSDPQKREAYNQSIGLKYRSKASESKPTPKKPQWEEKAASSQKSDEAPKSRFKPSREWQPKVPPRAKTDKKKTETSNTHYQAGAGFRDMFDALFRKEETPSPSPKASPPPPPPPPPASVGAKAVRGEDIQVEALISREEAEQGVVKTVNVQHTEPCKRCSATGRVNNMPCSVCQGEKQIITLRKLEVRVPPGVKPGSKVRVAKEGGKGSQGGEPGDLFLVIRLEETSGLKIEGLNVSYELSLSPAQAVLGAEVDIPTVKGKVKLNIPPMTGNGQVLRMKGQGVSLNGNTGDQYVTVVIQIPKTISPQAKQHYEALLKLENKTN